jgi:glycosyltransferase 2 family protein
MNAAKIFISLALLALVFRRIDLHQAEQALARVHPVTLIQALALALVGYLGRAARWSALLRRAGVRVSLIECYRLTLVGTFYGLVTPGRVGEFARVLHLGVPRSQTLPTVLWDRLGDVLLLEALAIPAFVLLDAWHGPLLAIYLLIVLATVALVLAVDSARVLAFVARRMPGAAERIGRWGSGATGVLRSAAFARGLLGGLFFYTLNFLGAFLLLRELTPQSPATLALIFPVIILLGNLPIAFGGLGLREQVAATAFARFGASAAVGPIFSLLWFSVITLAPALIGLLFSSARFAPGVGAFVTDTPGLTFAPGPHGAAGTEEPRG